VPTQTVRTGQSIADILVTQGALSDEKRKLVKLTQIQTGSPEEEIIRSKELVPEEAFSKAKAAYYNVSYVDLGVIPASPEALAVLSQDVAERFNVFPVAVDKTAKKLELAMADPMDLAAIDFVERKTGFHVKPCVAAPAKIKEYIQTKYSQSLSEEVTAAVADVSGDREQVKSFAAASKFGFVKEEKIAEIVSHILEFAIRARASDVHIEPQEAATRVRYRIDGILQEKLTIPREIHDSLISRIKILSGMKIDEKRIPQDGRFNFKAAEQDVDLRVSSLPTSWGEKIVMRLLKKTGGVPTLAELGLRGRGLKNLEDSILRPHGIILICGPTGSGKTTTLYSIISKINTSKVNIVTLEDPIEYKIAGVNQVQVNPAAGLTFASGLRSFLRQDPNVILVGEIRDQETADLAVQASLTGHLVFSTLHTNDAAGALPRLLDMGAEPYLLASSVTAIVAQRVVRKIHDKCRTSFAPDAKITATIKENLGTLWPQGREVKFSKGEGDSECGNSGYFGRVGIYEVMPITEKMGKLILERAGSADIEKLAREEGMVTLKQDGFLKVLEGITTIEEILRVAQE